MNEALLRAWNLLPDELRAPPASEDQLGAFESSHGPIPDQFRWFLRNCGGGPVGADWVDSIGNLAASHEKFVAESGPTGWTMRGVFIVGWDGAGNPYGIQCSTGRVIIEDHNFGGIREVAESFEAFLMAGLCTSGSPG